MSPSALSDLGPQDTATDGTLGNESHLTNGHRLTKDGTKATALPSSSKRTEFLLDRNLHKAFPNVKGGSGNYLYLADGRTIFDSSGGAAVSCVGHGNKRVIEAVSAVMNTGTPYLCSAVWGSEIVEELSEQLINGTGGQMDRVYLCGSGSEAMEATIKLARQVFYEGDHSTPRVNFIAREGSYHGNTLGALGMSGHVGRRAIYEPFLMKNVHHISACNSYRQRIYGESDASFVARKAAELEEKFQELGPETVIGFVAEPVVGAALGCVPSVPGYLRAMRDVCHRHGALFILDEVMSGMGRCGTLHAWQEEDVCPDLQTVGKGLAGGYQPVAAVFANSRVVNTLLNGTGQFVHGHTYQAMPIQAAAALEVQKIVQEENLVGNVKKQGLYLEKCLRSLLADHPNVGDIRGRGLFWGLEFVKDKKTKEPFNPKLNVAQRLHDTALAAPFNMTLYHGTGTADGVRGDHIIIAPAYNIVTEDVERIAQLTSAVVHQVFRELENL